MMLTITHRRDTEATENVDWEYADKVGMGSAAACSRRCALKK